MWSNRNRDSLVNQVVVKQEFNLTLYLHCRTNPSLKTFKVSNSLAKKQKTKTEQELSY